MMKKLTVVLIGLMLVSSVVAQEELPPPGILPDHPFYFLKTFVERVRLWFAFNPEVKARLHIEYSLRRLSELNASIAQGKWRNEERLRNDYEGELREAEVEANISLALGRNITDLTEHVCNMTYKHVLVLEKVLEKAPNASKSVIERVINASIERHAVCVERMQDRINRTEEAARRVNCTTDADCRNLFCTMILGQDTPLCKDWSCRCGAKWELNQTEWRERFGEVWVNESLPVIQRIRERIRIR